MIKTELTPMEKLETGYIAIAVDPIAIEPKMLRNIFVDTGTNKQVLTSDIRVATVDEEYEAIKCWTECFNEERKNPIQFEIKKVTRITTTTMRIED